LFDAYEVIARLDADILVLPETWLPHAGEGVVDVLRANGYHVELDQWITLTHSVYRPRVADPGDGWWCLGVASRLPVVERVDLPLPRTIADRAHPRNAIQLGVDVDGTRVDVVGVHTSSRLWWAAPMLHLRALAKAVAPVRGPAVLAGDFNLWGPGVERLLPGWRRTVRGRTYPSHRPHSQIDHVLVNQQVTALDARVVDDRQSDHRPVVARLRA
jgi:endonuclease/exonuclease/phosphatase family metal-dependent hydrolase